MFYAYDPAWVLDIRLCVIFAFAGSSDISGCQSAGRDQCVHATARPDDCWVRWHHLDHGTELRSARRCEGERLAVAPRKDKGDGQGAGDLHPGDDPREGFAVGKGWGVGPGEVDGTAAGGPNPEIRKTALKVLGGLGPAAAPALLTALPKQQSTDERAIILDGLRAMQGSIVSRS